MNESKAIARKLVAQSIKPLVDELDEEVRRKGTSEERAMLAEVHTLMNQLLGKGSAGETQKLAAGSKEKVRSRGKVESNNMRVHQKRRSKKTG